MAHLTLTFVKDGIVKTISVLAKKVKAEGYETAYYCHKNEAAIEWVLVEKTMYDSYHCSWSTNQIKQKGEPVYIHPFSKLHVRAN